MKHKVLLYICFILVIFIGTVLVYGNLVNINSTQQGQIKGAQVQAGSASIGLSPSSGLASSEFTISGSDFHTNNSEVTITWKGDTLLTSSNSTDEEGNFIATAMVPDDAKAGNYKVEVQTTGLELALYNNKDRFSWKQILINKAFASTKVKQTTKKAHAFFTVTESEPIPTKESTTTTIAAPDPTTSSITPTTSPSETTISTTAIPIETITPTVITSATSTTTAIQTTTSTKDVSSQPITTTTSNPRVSALPIIIKDDQNSSSITIDKDEAQANGEDEITIIIENETDGVPQIEVSGNGNTISEIKKEDNQYITTIKSTAPEEKIIKIKTAQKELPEIKVNFSNDNSLTNNNNYLAQKAFYSNWIFWVFVLFLAIVLSLWLTYRNKK